MTHPITQKNSAPSRERARRKSGGSKQEGQLAVDGQHRAGTEAPSPDSGGLQGAGRSAESWCSAAGVGGTYSGGLCSPGPSASPTCALTLPGALSVGPQACPSIGPQCLSLGTGSSISWGRMLAEGSICGMFSQGASAAALYPGSGVVSNRTQIPGVSFLSP